MGLIIFQNINSLYGASKKGFASMKFIRWRGMSINLLWWPSGHKKWILKGFFMYIIFMTTNSLFLNKIIGAREDIAKLFLRLTVGGLMLFHGIAKLMHQNDFIEQLLASHGFPTILALGVPIGEVLAPFLLIVGVCTRAASLVIAFTMIMSIYLALGGSAFAITAYGGLGGELNFFYLFVSLAIFLLGSGKYSLYRGNKFYLQ